MSWGIGCARHDLPGVYTNVKTYVNWIDGIVGGQDAVLGQFPHQVLWSFNGFVWCGGSIYNKSTIITAAHCCKPFEEGEKLV